MSTKKPYTVRPDLLSRYKNIENKWAGVVTNLDDLRKEPESQPATSVAEPATGELAVQQQSTTAPSLFTPAAAPADPKDEIANKANTVSPVVPSSQKNLVPKFAQQGRLPGEPTFPNPVPDDAYKSTSPYTITPPAEKKKPEVYPGQVPYKMEDPMDINTGESKRTLDNRSSSLTNENSAWYKKKWDWLDGSAKTFVNSIDIYFSNKYDGQNAKEYAPAIEAITGMPEAMKQPDFHKLLDFYAKWQDNAEANAGVPVLKEEEEKARQIKAAIAGQRVGGFYPEIDPRHPGNIGEALFNKAQDEDASQGIVTNAFNAITKPISNFVKRSAIDWSSQIPGVAQLPDELVSAGLKYSGLISKYLKTRKQFGDKDDSLSTMFASADVSTPRGPDGKPIKTSMPGVKELIEMGKKGSDINTDKTLISTKEKIQEAINKNIEDTQWHNDNVAIREQPSEYYKKKMAEGGNWYTMPEQLGMSSAETGYQFGATVADWTIGKAVSVFAPEAAIPAALVSAAINFYSVDRQRKSETYTEFYQYRGQKLDDILKSNNSLPLAMRDDASLVNGLEDSNKEKDIKLEAQQQIKASGKLTDNTKQQILSGVTGGLYGYKDKSVSSAIKRADYLADEFFARDYSPSKGEALENMLLMAPGGAIEMGFGKFVKGAAEGLKVTKVGEWLAKTAEVLKADTKIGRATSLTVEGIGDFYTKKIATKAGLDIALQVVPKAVLKNAMNIPSEVHEESAQYINGINYEFDNIEHNEPFVASLVRSDLSGLRGVGALLGTNPYDFKYGNKEDLASNALPAAIMTPIQSAPYSILQMLMGAHGKMKQRHAKSFVDNHIREMVDSETRMGKSAIYVARAVKGNSDEVIKYLTSLKTKLPEGVTAAQIDAEIDFAKKTYAVANSSAVRKYVTRNGEYGSEDHKILTGLIMDHYRSLEQSKNAAKQSYDEAHESAAIDHTTDIAFQTVINNINEGRNAKLNQETPATETKQAVAPDLAKEQTEETVSPKETIKAEAPLAAVSYADELSLYKLLSENQAVMALYENRINADKGKKATEITASSTQSILQRGLEIMNEIKAIQKRTGLSQEEMKSLPIPTMSDNTRDKYSVGAAAQAGVFYDLSMYNKLSGYNYKTTQDKKTKKSTTSIEKMTPSDHSKFVSKRIQEYRQARTDDKNNQDKEEADVVAVQAAEDVKQEAVDTAVPHPGQVSSEADPKTVVVETGEGQKEEVVVPETVPVAIDPELADENTVVPGTKKVETPEAPIVDESSEVNEDELFDNATAAADKLKAVAEEAPVGQDLSPEGKTAEVKEDAVVVVAEKVAEIDPTNVATSIFFSPTSTVVVEVNGEKMRTGKQLGDMLYSDDPLGDTTFDFNIEIDKNKTILSETPNKSDMTVAELNTLANQRESYKHANIYVLIHKNSGPHKGTYIATLSDPMHVAAFANQIMSDKALASLNKTRQDIIELDRDNKYNARTNGTRHKLVATLITLKDSFIPAHKDKTKTVVQRNISEIPGFALPKLANGETDWNNVTERSVNFGIGKGPIGKNAVMRADESLIGETVIESNTGNPFMLVKRLIDGQLQKVKINASMFHREDASVVTLIHNLAVNMLGSATTQVYINSKGEIGEASQIKNGVNTGLTAYELLNHIVNFGIERTKKDAVKLGDSRSFLLDKQFYIEDRGGQYYVQYGTNSMTVNNARTEKGKAELSAYINAKLHWTIEKTDISKLNGQDMTVGELFPTIARYLFDNKKDKIEFAKGFAITKEDIAIDPTTGRSLTWTAWLLKNNKLTSDAQDRIFAPPYMSMQGFDNVNQDSNPIVLTNGGESVKPAENKPQTPSTPIVAPTVAATPTVAPTTTVKETAVEMAARMDKKYKIKDIEKARRIEVQGVTDPVELKGINDKYDAQIAALDTAPVAAAIATTDIAESTVKPAAIPIQNLMGRKPRPKGPASVLKANIKKVINIAHETAWIQDKVGGDVESTSDIIRLAGDIQAMGVMRSSAITLWTGAEEGTGYHEAFHKVSLLMMDRSQRLRIYNLAEQTYPELKGKPYTQIEEFLAERFRNYVLDSKTSNDPYHIKRFFRRMANLVRNLFNMSPRNMERLYSDISLGVFKGHSINENSLREFKVAYGDEAAYGFSKLGLKTIQSYEKLFDIRDALTYALFNYAGAKISDINDISKIKFENLKDSMLAGAEVEQDPQRKELFQEIYDKFDTVFKPEIQKNLALMGIREVNSEDAERRNQDQTSEEVASHIVASHEVSKAENALVGIKMFIATMEKSSFLEDDTTPETEPLTGWPKFIPFDIAWNTMLFDLHDERTPTEMMNKMKNLSKNSPFYFDLIRRLDESEDENFKTQFWNTMFSHRHQYVNIGYSERIDDKSDIKPLFTVRDSDVDRATRLLPALWGQMFAEDENIFPRNEKGEKVFSEANLKVIRDRYFDGLLKDARNASKTGKTVFASKIGAQEVMIDLNTEEGRQIVLKEISDLYNQVGVNIDVDTLNEMVRDDKGSSAKGVQNLVSYLTATGSGSMNILFNNIFKNLIDNKGVLYNKKNVERDISGIFAKEKFAESLAVAFARSHPTPEEITVLGADGARLYQMSLNSYLTDKVRDINKDPNTILELLTSTYNMGAVGYGAPTSIFSPLLEAMGIKGGVPTGSRALKQLVTGQSNGIEFKTFVKLAEEGVGDRGRGYTDVSPAEDYVMKLAAKQNNYMTLPTMADKPFYGFITGVQLINEQVSYIRNINQETGKNDVTFIFGSETVGQMSDYLRAEVMAIKEAWAEFKDKDGDSSKLLDVYHVNGKNSDNGKKWSGGHGNGLRFRMFGNMSTALAVNGEVKTSNSRLNEYLDAAAATGNNESFDNAIASIENTLLANTDEANHAREMAINSSLMAALYNEMTYAASIGVIDFDGKNTYSLKNKLLDKGLHESKSKQGSESINKTDNAGVKLNNYEEQYSIINILGNGLINEIISTTEFEKLISKDSAFYSTVDDKIKRLSSILSTGTNLRTDWPVGHRLNGITSFNVSEMEDNMMVSTELSKIRQSFISGAINDLMNRNGKERIPNLDKLIANAFKPEAERDVVMQTRLAELGQENPEFAIGRNIGESNAAGYGLSSKGTGDINETDGTVLISPTMYKNIVEMLGEWSPEVAEAYNLLESEDQSWMADDELYQKVIKASVKPLKTIYFGESVNPELKLLVPKLDKMAMFCLFRVFSNGDLNPLYNRMNKVGDTIEMVPLAKAVKVGNTNRIDYQKEIDKGSDLSNMAVEKQQYKYLRRQLVTNPHESTEIPLGTQTNKTAISNIDKERTYSNIQIGTKKGVTGQELIQMWKEANVELSNKGYESMAKELGMKFDAETGEPSVDKTKLFAMIAKDARDSKMTDDIIQELENGAIGEDVPLQALADNKWVESRIISMIGKKVVDVKTPGGMYIQISAFGLRTNDVEKVNQGKITQDEFNAKYKGKYLVNGGRALNFHNDDGTMDAAISINAFKDIIPKELQKKSFVKQQAWLLMHNIIGPNSDPGAIGYRIPNQGLSSTSGLRIVDVIPEVIGDSIVLPSAFTKLTGSDFDIDKLYVARYNYKMSDTGRMEKVQFNDSLKGKNGESIYRLNSKEAVENRLLDVFMASITDPENVFNSRMPLDMVTDELKDDILKDIESLIPNEETHAPFEYYSPAFQSSKKQEYTTGKQGIAQYALSNSHHVVTQTVDLQFNAYGPIKKFNMSSLAGVYGRDNKHILDWLSAMINAHVDVAKDPYIIRLNINPFTYNMSNLLLRTGMGEDTFYFMTQRILKDVSAKVALAQGNYGVDDSISKRQLEENIIEQVKRQYINMAMKSMEGNEPAREARMKKLDDLYNKVDPKTGRRIINNEKVFNSARTSNNKNSFLRGQLSRNMDTFEDIYNQLLVLETFRELTPFSNKLSELVKYSKIDSKKWGSTFTSMRLFNENVKAINSLGKESVFKNVSSVFHDTFLGAKLDNAYNMSRTIGGGLFFRTTVPVESFIDKIISLSGSSALASEDLVGGVANAVDSKIKSEFWLNKAKEEGVDVPGLFYGDNTMARRLYNIQQKIRRGEEGYAELKSNIFLDPKVLRPEYAPDVANKREKKPDHIGVIAGATKNPRIATQIKEYHAELTDSPLADVKSFANDFILYQFFSNGENAAFNQVKIAEDLRKGIKYYDFVSTRLRDLNNNSEAFANEEQAMEDIYLNRWFDDKLVPVVDIFKKGTSIDVNGVEVNNDYVAPAIPSSIPYYTENNNVKTTPLFFIDEKSRMTGINSEQKTMFAPYVKIKSSATNMDSFFTVYKLIGSVETELYAGATKTSPVYQVVNKKSYKAGGRSVVEFGFDKSIVPSNNLEIPSMKPKFDAQTGVQEKLLSPAYVRNLFATRNDKFKSNTIGAKAIEKRVEKFSTFEPITKFDLDGTTTDDVDMSSYELNPNERLLKLESIINESVSKSLETKEFGVEDMANFLERADASEGEISAAKYRYGIRLLADVDKIDTNVSEETKDATTSFKTSAKAYANELISDKENLVFKDHFQELDDMSDVEKIRNWYNSSLATKHFDVINFLSTDIQKEISDNSDFREQYNKWVANGRTDAEFRDLLDALYRKLINLHIDEVRTTPKTNATGNTFTSVTDERFTKNYPTTIQGLDTKLIQEYSAITDEDVQSVFEGEHPGFITDLEEAYNDDNTAPFDSIDDFMKNLLDTNEKVSDRNQFELFANEGEVTFAQMDTINEGFLKSGLSTMTSEEFKSLSKELLESLKACFGAK